MNDKMLAFKAMITAFFTGLGAFLGWKGVMFAVWLTAMALDYISGSAAAMKNGEWSSTTARQGLWHKGGMILVVAVAAIADALFTFFLPNIPLVAATVRNPGLLFPLVLAWYIITEAGSILENAVKMGAKVPAWLVKVLKISMKTVDAAGEKGMSDDGKGD